jgi:hypothetical protein
MCARKREGKSLVSTSARRLRKRSDNYRRSPQAGRRPSHGRGKRTSLNPRDDQSALPTPSRVVRVVRLDRCTCRRPYGRGRHEACGDEARRAPRRVLEHTNGAWWYLQICAPSKAKPHSQRTMLPSPTRNSLADLEERVFAEVGKPAQAGAAHILSLPRDGRSVHTRRQRDLRVTPAAGSTPARDS